MDKRKIIYLDDAIETVCEEVMGVFSVSLSIGYDVAEAALEKLSSAQLEVIRCKDCAYCGSDVVDAPYGLTKKIWWCDRMYEEANENLTVEPDDFCSWAERRQDG